MPNTQDLRPDCFAPIGACERDFLEAVTALAPDVLAPILTQLDGASTFDDKCGWLIIRGARGEPCHWPAGTPFEVVADWPGPQGCYDIMLWFDDTGLLQSVELLLFENSALDLKALTVWLRAMP